MTRKKYTKAPTVIHSSPIHEDVIYVKPIKKRRPISAWEFFKNTYDEILELLTLSRAASLTIPVFLILMGISILYTQVRPEIDQFALEKEGYLNQGTTPLVAGDYIQERQIYLSNPGSDYFKILTTNAFNQNVLKTDPVAEQYEGTFLISLPSLDLIDLQVTANVDSGSEKNYEGILQHSLAHMKGTGLPISDIKNNIVIYGHSGNGDYYERTKDPAGAFSKLQKIKLGDEIIIIIDNIENKYKVSKTKIVQPNDTSIINGNTNQETLTLFTCFPNGSAAKRFIVVAKPI